MVERIRRFPVGKLPMEVLARQLNRNRIFDKRVLVGPAIGEDAAVIDTGGPRYLIAKTDPITFTIDRIGWYAVHVNANDIATLGGQPKWFLATLLLPESETGERDVEEIFDQIMETCQGLGISLIGGHTEITYDLHRPIVVGQMLGEVEREKLIRKSGARRGDALLLTKGIAVEGTAIIAREKEKELVGIFGERFLSRAKDFIYQPGISVVKDASVAMAAGRIHSMHDPTEGGIATAVHEITHAADLGAVIDAETVVIFPETKALCNHYHLDPLGLIASGALLIAAEASEAPQVKARLEKEGIATSIIGQLVDRSQGIKLRRGSAIQDLPLFEQDELTKILR